MKVFFEALMSSEKPPSFNLYKLGKGICFFFLFYDFSESFSVFIDQKSDYKPYDDAYDQEQRSLRIIHIKSFQILTKKYLN